MRACLVCAVCPPVTSRAKYTSVVPKHTSAALRPRVGTVPARQTRLRHPPRCPPLVIPCRGGIPRAAAASRALSSSPTCGHGGQRDGMPDPGVPCTCAAHPRTRAARPSQSPYLSRPSDSGLCGANAEEKGFFKRKTHSTTLAPALPTQVQPRRMIGW